MQKCADRRKALQAVQQRLHPLGYGQYHAGYAFWHNCDKPGNDVLKSVKHGQPGCSPDPWTPIAAVRTQLPQRVRIPIVKAPLGNAARFVCSC